MKEEIWLPVKNFESRFKISNHGRLLSIGGKYGGQKILCPHVSKMGYMEATLRMKPMTRKARIHTLVAEHFILKKSISSAFVNHKDGIKTNNYFENLEWVTPAENVLHAVETGLMNFKGENHPSRKLTDLEIITIRQFKTYCTPQYFAKAFEVNKRTIMDVIQGISWTHI